MLGTSANFSLRFYDNPGHLIQTLDIGQQEAGVYKVGMPLYIGMDVTSGEERLLTSPTLVSSAHPPAERIVVIKCVCCVAK